MLLASCGWWQTYAEEKSHSALGDNDDDHNHNMLMTTTIIEKWLRTKIQDYILCSAKPTEVIVDREIFCCLWSSPSFSPMLLPRQIFVGCQTANDRKRGKPVKTSNFIIAVLIIIIIYDREPSPNMI